MSADPSLAAAEWIKSSYSDAVDGQRVEFSRGFVSADGATGGAVPVRDSKVPRRAPLVFPAGAFASSVTAVRAGTLGVG